MYTAKLEYKFQKYSSSCGDELHSLLSVYYLNGQILDNRQLISYNENKVEVFVPLPERNSLSKNNSNIYVTRYIKRIKNLGLLSSKIQIIGFDFESLQICKCKSRSAYILYTDRLTMESPLRCYDCFHPIPLYKINRSKDKDYSDILNWESNYKSCDSLQINCTVGERFGEKQLFNHNSSLSKQGREISFVLSKYLGKPVYYYLHKSKGFSSAKEKERVCPICNGKWKLNEPLHKIFDFECKLCKILSNIAINVSA